MSVKQEPAGAARRAAPAGPQGPVGISLVHEREEVNYAPATGGIACAVGNLAAGFLTDRLGGARVVAVALVWLTVGLVMVPLATGHLGAALAVVGFYVVGAFAITTPQQHRLIGIRLDATPIVISLNQSVLYLAIAMSGLVGAAGIELLGSRYVSLLAAALALLALRPVSRNA